MVSGPRYQNRHHSNGQFAYSGDMERMCVCGHKLGVHAAVGPHDCFAGTNCPDDPNPPGVFCDCQKFRPSRRKAARAALAKES